MKEHDKNGYGLPGNVRHECVWIIRDKERLKKMLKESEGEYRNKEVIAYKRLDAMHRALLEIPVEYRSMVIKSIVDRSNKMETYVHENTLKKYKRKFLYYFAKNMSLY